MTDIESRFEKFSNKLLNEIISINNNFLLYKHLLKKREDRLDAIHYANAFFSMIGEALFTDVIISLSRLYEKNYRKSYGNLYNYLDFIDTNSNLFTVDEKIRRVENIGGLEEYIKENFPSSINELIENHRNMLNDMESKIDSLMTWRDKYYAHNDGKYFFESEKLYKEVPLFYKDIEKLIHNVSMVVNAYVVQFNGKITATTYPDVYDIDVILDIVNEYHQNRLREFED